MTRSISPTSKIAMMIKKIKEKNSKVSSVRSQALDVHTSPSCRLTRPTYIDKQNCKTDLKNQILREGFSSQQFIPCEKQTIYRGINHQKKKQYRCQFEIYNTTRGL